MSGIKLGCIEIPVFTAVGVNYDDPNKPRLIFQNEMPVDGSMALSIINLDDNVGEFPGSVQRKLVFFNGSNSNVGINVISQGSANVHYYLPTGWVTV